MLNIGIIGTSGRNEDGAKLNVAKFAGAKNIAYSLIKDIRGDNPVCLISGGSSWMDHVAVSLFLDGLVDKLTLYIPADFVNGKYDESAVYGRTLNRYHYRFSNKCYISEKVASLSDIEEARLKGAQLIPKKGFFLRNNEIALQSKYLIAFTFGEGATVKSGGTAYTVSIYHKAGNKDSYHIDLNTRKIYSPAVI